MLVNAESRLREIDGSGIFLSCSHRPLSIHSVLDRLRHKRLELKKIYGVGEAHGRERDK